MFLRLTALALLVATTAGAQIMPDMPGMPAGAAAPTPVKDSGQTVNPAFEGWYRNPDGTYSLSFGYYNRNARENVEIPIGPNNFVSPGPQNQGQPSVFQTRRHWGVFAVKVPADFGTKEVVWTVNFRGQKFEIPGSLRRGWEIDAIIGEAGTGNQPPVVRFDSAGAEGAGPLGITGPPLKAKVGETLALTAWVKDDGKASSSISSDGRAGVAPTVTWIKHQGPGAVKVTPVSPLPAAGRGGGAGGAALAGAGRGAAVAAAAAAELVNASPTVSADASGKIVMNATFDAPGEYILRLRVNDVSGISGGGHSQCCWTNGFVKVTVTR